MNRKSAVKTAAVYAAVALFCALFGYIYERYSHGVYSGYMVYLFLFPLLGGAVPFSLAGLAGKLPYPGRAAFNLYNSGVASLTVGSCIRGVLEIFGTTSSLTPLYWVAGTALSACGLGLYLFTLLRRRALKHIPVK